MVAPDPVDVRLLTAIAETGRAAVPEIAARLGMDVREVAARLAALSTTGLPMVVGVECDQQGIRNALAAANAWTSQHSGAYRFQGPPSGGHPVQTPHSGGYPVPPPPSGSYPPHTPSGSYPPHTPSGPQQPPPAGPAPATGQPDQMSTWGPPGSASWARGDQQPGTAASTGKVGGTLDWAGPEGEQVTIHLVEVVDPADFLFTAAGYQLQAGDRAVVVHTELTNRGSVAFGTVPDQHLVLVATDGSTVSKAPVSLSSRPPHRTGVQPGETAGGHTVYVLPDSTELSAIRWSAGTDQPSLTWDITDL